MNHEGKVRDMERANVDRWFPPSPLGPMFDAGDGRMLPIPADAGAPWREEAYARIDKFLVESRPPSQGAMVAIIIAFTLLLLALQPVLGFSGGQIGGIVMGGLALWHGHDFYLLWRYRQDLKALRARIAASLVLRSPLPAELGARFRRTNHWRTALHIWVWSLVTLAFGSLHFADPDRVPPAMTLLVPIGIVIAWLLYFASRRVDQSQQR
ncbi:MAG: hypothetical protein V4808_02780 [Pseudomonadota bacterium]